MVKFSVSKQLFSQNFKHCDSKTTFSRNSDLLLYEFQNVFFLAV